MTVLRVLRDLPARVLIFCIELYRTYVSPLRLPTCRFAPTCSEYAVEALRTHGALKGSLLACVRLAKCAPWHPGGWNPVPERGSWRAVTHTSNDDIHEFATVDEQRST